MQQKKLYELITGEKFKLNRKDNYFYRKLLYHGKSYDGTLVHTEFAIDSNWNLYKFYDETLVYVD